MPKGSVNIIFVNLTPPKCLLCSTKRTNALTYHFVSQWLHKLPLKHNTWQFPFDLLAFIGLLHFDFLLLKLFSMVMVQQYYTKQTHFIKVKNKKKTCFKKQWDTFSDFGRTKFVNGLCTENCLDFFISWKKREKLISDVFLYLNIMNFYIRSMYVIFKIVLIIVGLIQLFGRSSHSNKSNCNFVEIPRHKNTFIPGMLDIFLLETQLLPFRFDKLTK